MFETGTTTSAWVVQFLTAESLGWWWWWASDQIQGKF